MPRQCALREWVLVFSGITGGGWLPGLADEGMDSPGRHDFSSSSYRAWTWGPFRLERWEHTP